MWRDEFVSFAGGEHVGACWPVQLSEAASAGGRLGADRELGFEIVLREFSLDALFGTALSAVTADLISRAFSGSGPFFSSSRTTCSRRLMPPIC